MFWKKLTDWVVYLIVRILIGWIQSIRLETCRVLARAVAVLAADVLQVRGKVVEENLGYVFPQATARERRQLTRRMWEHLVLMVCEVAHAPRKIHETNWRDYVHLHRRRELVKYLLDERPTLLVSGHFGNFEIAGYMAGLLGFPSFTIARPLDNPYLDRFLNRFRAAKGQYILPKQGSAPLVQQVLRKGGTLSLLGDQHAGPKGCWVEFLGRPASCHKALALFTLTSGAPLLVAYAKRVGDPLQFEVGLMGVADPTNLEGLSNVPALTQWYNRMIEQIVMTAPEQYWWVHRRWKGEPPRRGAAQKAAA